MILIVLNLFIFLQKKKVIFGEMGKLVKKPLMEEKHGQYLEHLSKDLKMKCI